MNGGKFRIAIFFIWRSLRPYIATNVCFLPSGPTDKKFCPRGEPIECGREIRLQHLTTSRNLHSHHFSSPLSSSQEVSAFGDGGDGDTGDVWSVVCDDDFWQRETPVLFKHTDTGVFLGASGHTFGRPIHGQMEIVGQSMPDAGTK
jgi:dolichyl-phosphate-mannose--protein O-mannosyl transferase